MWPKQKIKRLILWSRGPTLKQPNTRLRRHGETGRVSLPEFCTVRGQNYLKRAFGVWAYTLEIC